MVTNPDQFFYVSNEAVLKTKQDLLRLLRVIDETVFESHVNAEKNDFASWTRAILGEKRLAKKLDQTTNVDEMIHFIEETIRQKRGRKRDKKSIISQIVGAIINK